MMAQIQLFDSNYVVYRYRSGFMKFMIIILAAFGNTASQYGYTNSPIGFPPAVYKYIVNPYPDLRRRVFYL